MRILVQNYRNGELQMLEVPGPLIKKGSLLIQTKASLVSIGTEKAMIDVARKSLLGKALARPDWVKQVIDKIKTEGLMEAWRQSKARLDMPVPLGYSCAGVVIQVNLDERNFCIGDRVACAGSGYASHAELNVIPTNLCVKIPDNVSFEDASYVALGGIAMEAVRLAKVELGFKVGVIGLGLLGQLTVQVLKSAGCHVMGVDISKEKCELSLLNGAELSVQIGKDDPISASNYFSNGYGLDSVIIFASTESNEPLIQAAHMCRERGRIVAGGLIGLDVPRKLFYEKELDLAVSRAWGPGIYDPDYEERNVKYPFPYVRWTAQRNMEEFLKLISNGMVKITNLTTHLFPFDKALEAYDIILNKKEPAIGVVIQYSEESDKLLVSNSGAFKIKEYKTNTQKPMPSQIGIGLIGAGLFARGTFLPTIKKINDIRLVGVATASGLSGEHIKEKFNFEYCTTDYKELLSDPNIHIIFILTRHNSHSKFVCESLKAGKAVFVEKPLCINEDQLKEIIDIYYSLVKDSGSPFLMVGFNRRFAPATIRAIEFLGDKRSSSVVQIRCNAGYIPVESWVHKIDEGGGRIIGEVCHFVDLSQAITGGYPEKVFASCVYNPRGLRDNVAVTLQMDNGAAVNIIYTSYGDKAFSREEVQIFSGGKVCIIDNFKNITFVSTGKIKKNKRLEVDRGYLNELKTTIHALKERKISPIDFQSIIATTLTTFAIEESITRGEAVEIDLMKWLKV